MCFRIHAQHGGGDSRPEVALKLHARKMATQSTGRFSVYAQRKTDLITKQPPYRITPQYIFIFMDAFPHHDINLLSGSKTQSLNYRY
jgi:hypothetical protein